MGLTSNKVLAAAVLCAVLLFVGTVWYWPRLARRNWRAVSGRIGLLFATQLSLFASIGLAANQSFGFYGSWADLFGQENEQGVVLAGGVSGSSEGPLQVTGTQTVPVSGGGQPQIGGQIQKVTMTGATSHITTSALVYLPPEYFQPQYKARTFPVSVVLTGYPGTTAALVKGLHYPQTVQELAKKGKMQPMILVMLRPTVAPPRDTECADIPGGPQTETFFGKDLPYAVRSHYRVGPIPYGWGIIGDSTGGYCALKMAMHHPLTYAAGVGLSPYYKAAVDPTTGDLFGGKKDLKNRADLMWSIQHMKAPDTSLLVTSSKSGEKDYKTTLKFIQAVEANKKTRISSIILDSGGHNFNTWLREIPAAMQWMSGRLSDR